MRSAYLLCWGWGQLTYFVEDEASLLTLLKMRSAYLLCWGWGQLTYFVEDEVSLLTFLRMRSAYLLCWGWGQLTLSRMRPAYLLWWGWGQLTLSRMRPAYLLCWEWGQLTYFVEDEASFYHSKYITQIQQQRPESPKSTLTWHACKYKEHKLHQRYILLNWWEFMYLVFTPTPGDTIGDSSLCCCTCVMNLEH